MMSPRLEPQEYPLCYYCDGQGNVEVNSIIDVGGVVRDTTDIHDFTGHPLEILIDCPFCDATGNQPRKPNRQIWM